MSSLTNTRTARGWLAALTLLALAARAPAAQAPGAKPQDPQAKAFQELARKVQTDPTGSTEQDVRRLITLSERLGRCYAASLAVKSYLARNFNPSPSLLALAAENALLAGDFRAAVARYKAYLASNPDGAGASEAAARLLTTQIHFLGSEDDAYQFVELQGEKLRGSVLTRKLDIWELDQARHRRDFPTMAKTLALAFAQKLPLEQERLYYWDYLNLLMDEVVQGRQEHFAALPYCKRLVGAVRGDRRRQLRYALHVANLAFKASAAGKTEADLDVAYGSVVSAAKSYLDAFPSAQTLKEIVNVFADGGARDRLDEAALRRQFGPKSRFFVAAFEKLDERGREDILAWRLRDRRLVAPHLASPAQWAELGAKHAALFRRSPAARLIPFQVAPPKGATAAQAAALYRRQAQFLDAVPSRYAAAIAALARADLAAKGGEGLKAAAKELVENHGWHLRLEEPFSIFAGWMVPAARAVAPKGTFSGEDEARLLVWFGDNYLAKSLMALDRAAARRYIETAWDHPGGKDPNDKSPIIERLAALAWVPYERRLRKEVFNEAYSRFHRWANWVRRESRARQPKVSRQAVATIATIEDAFREAMNPDAVDPAKAPNALCREFALALVAQQHKDLEGFVKHAREFYKLARDFQARKTPFAFHALLTLMENRNENFDKIDFQLEVVADLLGRYDPKGENDAIATLVEQAVRWRDRGLWRAPKNRMARTLRLCELFEKATMAHLAKGEFVPQFFEWFRGTRAGDHWKAQERGLAVMEKLIEGRYLEKTSWRPREDVRSAACSYMWLIRDEFPALAREYPLASAFDEMFVAEARRTGYLDWRYWDFGRDGGKRVVDAAAEILAGFKTLPLGYDGERVAYERSALWNWQARALAAHPKARDAMLAAIEAAYGKTRYDTYAMGRAYFTTRADVSTPAGRKEFFDRLARYLDRVRQTPAPVSPPFMDQLSHLTGPKKLTDQEANVLLSIFAPSVQAAAEGKVGGSWCVPLQWPGNWGFETMGQLLADHLVASGRRAELYRVAPHLWALACETRNSRFQDRLARVALTLAERGEHDLALVWGTVGLAVSRNRLAEEVRTTLVALRSKTLSQIGGVIPVRREDPRYPLYAAQAAYFTGKFQSAWELYRGRRSLFQKVHRDLDPNFSLWLVNRHTELGEFDEADALARVLIQWFDSVREGFQPELRARLLLAYANIAFAQKEYPRARALYERIAAASEFEGTRAQVDAQIRVAEVDRLTERFEECMQRLEKLSRRKDPYVQADSFYQMALAKFDQEEYREALDYLDQVFARVPDHAEARILEGRTKIKLRKLEEPTEIQIGTLARKRFIVPGRPLRVHLEDRNLAIVGKSANIEIRAWTDSGDEEGFNLLPFGDSKTRFRGEIPTALAPLARGDGTLQVLGGDVVHYDFSEAFKKAHKIALAAPQSLTVVSDGELLVSSGKILTKEERQARALEAMIRKRLGEKAEQKKVALSTLRPENQVKPGNKFNVRVIDPDRSTTAGRDKVAVKVSTASGDAIEACTLTETDTHSGVFEGSVQTAASQPIAYASDSEEGRDPNFAISRGNYPPWVALPDSARPKTFAVDLNDNVALGKMKIVADVAGRKLKSFEVQTSFNGREFTTVGAWPKQLEPWDGSLRLELVRYGDNNRAPAQPSEFLAYLRDGFVKAATPKFTLKPTSLAFKRGFDVAGHADRMKLAGERQGSWYIAHLYGAFYQPLRRIRTFQIEPRGNQPRTRFFLLIDGKPGETPTVVRRSLGKGVHRIDVLVGATRKDNPTFELRCDTDQPPFSQVVPAELFDPARHPQIKAAIYREPARIAANGDATAFEVAFNEGTRARVVRLFITDFEADAPAITSLQLADAAGKAVLPTTEDFMALRKNQVLEIVPGDRVTVAYTDPTVVTEGREHHEASLTATFRNAVLSASFAEYTVDGQGERHARYIPMRRFKPGDKISVFINDPDCDVSDKQDVVKFAARTSEGKPVELPALETEPHSGVFVGGLFPVGTQPKRPSEVKVAEGDDIIISYLDAENTDPGIPWTRTTTAEQTWYEPPELRVYGVTSQPLTAEELEQAAAPAKSPRGPKAPAPGDKPEALENVTVTRSLVVTWPEQVEEAKPTKVLLRGPFLVEVLFPYIAQSPESTATIYLQTTSGQKAHAAARKAEPAKPAAEKAAQPKAAPPPFDIAVPGTIKLQSRPSNTPGASAPPGYKTLILRGNPYASDALDDGRFSFNVPYALGKLPEKSLAVEQPFGEQQKTQPVLYLKGNDQVVLAFKFKDPAGAEYWLTRRVVLDADPFFDITDRRYRESLQGAYVGETAYFRVIDPVCDASDKQDSIEVQLATAAGLKRTLPLTETFSHSGVFKGYARLVYSGEVDAAKAPDALPVNYGDVVTAVYQRKAEAQEGGYKPQEARLERKLLVYKGSNGDVIPFTKRFKDPEIAVRTQFTVAEAYFELAKRHRELGRHDLASKEIAQGKKVLEEAIRDYPDTEARAQADYLLAELALEFGNEAKDPETRKKFYLEAASRFGDIVASYPDSPYAPRSQYKKALVFEKMGMIDQACEEYVKLSYRYPENELVAETIARLGQYFLTKGKELRKEAAAKKDKVEREKAELKAKDMFKTAGQVFGRLGARFPSHRLAGKTAVLSAQCFMQAEDLEKAVAVFQKVIANPKMDKDLVAESMYWCGDCYMRQDDPVNAYRMFKKLTWDYPASKWAKFARGRLTEEALVKVAESEE